MKITVTGSLGYISTPLVEKLVKKGHSVTLISSNADKQTDIEALGAMAAIGVMEDVDFLTDAFTGADTLYCMLAPYGNFADPANTADAVIKRADAVVNNYGQAIRQSGVKRVVYLSSMGAAMDSGSGLIIIHRNAEKTLSKLPADVRISFIRPAGFYKNMFACIGSIKRQGVIAASYGADDRVAWVSNLDIADAIVDELETRQVGRKVRYVVSEVLTCTEAAHILGDAIGKPDLKWVTIPDEQELEHYQAFGINESLTSEFVAMNTSIHTGRFYEDYNRHRPAPGKVKLNEFANEFGAAYGG
ncbi:SDR family oxidoreductase [Spirosoma pollinicola]|uniref:NAD-dependent dehydratase n=1 Tax=Spirosoma pollinicola TaxID=2057025 RepID=A0A2K8Z9P1_9BACT|nr:NAD(P)H-binding protein [Spirosoma pollinicola]AUD06598.1 NAD-dependent dehydratase [Spirosoma pollinicola]